MKALKNFLHFILVLVLLVGVSCKSKTTNKTDEKGQNVAQAVRVSGSSIKVASEFVEAGLQGDFNRLAELCCKDDNGPYTSYEDVKNLDLSDIGFIEKIIREENSEADPENLKLVVLRAKVLGELRFYCLLVFKTPAGYKIYIDNYPNYPEHSEWDPTCLWIYPAIKDSLASRASDFYSQFKKEEENLLVPHNKAKEEAFLKENAKKPGVKVTASGLQYKVITEGSGPLPKEMDAVNIHCRITLIDGTEFGSTYKRNEPKVWPVKYWIKGLTEALQLMKVGSKWQVFIPSNLALGESGKVGDKQVIGSNAALIIEVELLGIKPNLINDNIATMEREIMTAWGEIENAYNRRADIISKLVEAIEGKSNANEAYEDVSEALMRVKQIQSDEKLVNDPEAFNNFAKAQNDLGVAVSALLISVEKQTAIMSSQIFRDIQMQLEGVGDRIMVERQRYNEAAQEFNSAIPILSISGKKFSEKPYFKSE